MSAPSPSPAHCGAGLGFYRAAHHSAEQNRALTNDRMLAMPVLAVSADQGSTPDMAGPLRPFADDLRGETIAHSGHFIPEEQPDALASLLGAFIAGQ